MAMAILKILATIILTLLGVLMTWVVFVGTLMSHETTKFELADYVAIVAFPTLFVLLMWAMWG